MQLIQYRYVSSFSIVITNHFIGEDFCLENPSIDGYKAMGFNVTQLTHDVEQSGFTIKTGMPIPMLVYGDSFQWAKYGHHILPPSLDLTSLNSLSAMDGHDRPLKNQLCSTVVSRRIFIRSQSLIAR